MHSNWVEYFSLVTRPAFSLCQAFAVEYIRRKIIVKIRENSKSMFNVRTLAKISSLRKAFLRCLSAVLEKLGCNFPYRQSSHTVPIDDTIKCRRTGHTNPFSNSNRQIACEIILRRK